MSHTTKLAPLLLAGLAAWSSAASASPILSTVTTINAAANGVTTPGGNATYSPGEGIWGIFLATGALSTTPSFLNTTDTAASLDITLTSGAHQYTAYFLSDTNAVGLTLYFDGTSTPGLSVYAAEGTPSTSVAAWTGSVVGTDGGVTTGTPTTNWTDGTNTVSVTGLQFYNAIDVSNLGAPGVGVHDTIPTSITQSAVTFTLDVTAVPEPLSALLLLPAIGGLIAVRRRSPGSS